MPSRKLLVSAVAALAAGPMLVSADSDIGIGGAGTSASANLDFRIVIPQFVYFRVGSAAAGTVDRVDFDLLTAGAQPGAGGTVIANGGSGDGVDGDLFVNLVTNVASVTIAATGGNLTNGTDNIPFTQINTADGGVIPIPAFGGSGNLAAGLPGALLDTWSYEYNNDTPYPPGTYNGTVTYTVTAL
jgi:hypothetical protein